jgi:hypothetical protein
MAKSFVLENAALDILSDAFKAYLDDGVLEITTAAAGLLVTITLPDQANVTSVNGLITFPAMGPFTATGAGVAAIGKIYTNAKGALVATINVGLAAATPTLVLDNTNIAVDQVVNITAGATITVPAGS